MPDSFPVKVTASFSHTISIEQFGLYAVSITARCQGKRWFSLIKEQNLRLEINGKQFREIPPEKNIQLWKIPPAWNGTELKGLSKTIVFILPLNVEDYTFTFFAEPEALIEKFEYKLLPDIQNVVFDLSEKAEDGDKRPWYTFAFVNLPLRALKADVSTQWHYFDGDDVKLIVDNNIKPNSESKKYHDWLWSAKPDFFSKPKRKEKTFTENLPAGTHYVEFWADKTPILHTVSFNLGDFKPKRTPTLRDPKWTGDLNDDTETMLLARLILGEMEGQPKEAKLGAGFTVKNRLKKSRSNWGFYLKEIILKESQYDAFKNSKTVKKVKDPLSNVSKTEWEDCYELAEIVLSGKEVDPTSGATHFYSTATGTGFPWWATEDAYKTKIGITYFYELES